MPGYPTELFVEPVPDALQCVLCSHALNNAQVLCSEEHQACKDCIVSLPVADEYVCPAQACRREYWLAEIRESKFVDRTVQGLAVRCRRYKAGCDWVGTLRSADGHAAECRYLEVRCPRALSGCEDRIERRHIASHAHLCEFALVNCARREEGCMEMYPRNQKQSHLEVCAFIACNYCKPSCAFVGSRQACEAHRIEKKNALAAEEKALRRKKAEEDAARGEEAKAARRRLAAEQDAAIAAEIPRLKAVLQDEADFEAREGAPSIRLEFRSTKRLISALEDFNKAAGVPVPKVVRYSREEATADIDDDDDDGM